MNTSLGCYKKNLPLNQQRLARNITARLLPDGAIHQSISVTSWKSRGEGRWNELQQNRVPARGHERYTPPWHLNHSNHPSHSLYNNILQPEKRIPNTFTTPTSPLPTEALCQLVSTRLHAPNKIHTQTHSVQPCHGNIIHVMCFETVRARQGCK